MQKSELPKSELPLKGIRVLDFTHVLAGPFCTYQLAVMGADVIKVESQECIDMMRFNGPDAAFAEQDMGLAFQAQSANKRALVLDLKQGNAAAVLDRLVRSADVLVVNYRKSAAQKLSIDYDRIKAINPAIIYCSLSGYGQTGPKADHPAYDNVIQAFSGLMAATGTEESGPVRVGPPVLDYGTGAQAAMAIMGSLFQRERTGIGNFIDIAMLDSALMLMSSIVAETAKTAKPPTRMGNRSARATYGCYTTRKGEIMIGAYTRQQMSKLWRALGKSEKAAQIEQREHLSIDESFNEDTEQLCSIFKTRSAQEWEAILIAADVPAARVRTLDECMREPQLQSRSVLQKIANDVTQDKQDLTVPVSAWQSSVGSPRVTTAPPTVGEHTAEILTELGFNDDEINRYCETLQCTGSTTESQY